MSRKQKDPGRKLRKAAEKQNLRNRIVWLRLQLMRFFYDRNNLMKDISKWANAHDKAIKKALLLTVIIGTILFAVLFLADAFLSSITVYRDGIPVAGPGAQ